MYAHLDVCSVWVSLEFGLQFIVTLEVIICVGVFDIRNEGMLLADLDVIVGQLILIMLILGTFYLVFIGILGVLIKVRLSFAIYTDFEHFPGVRISSAGRYSILDDLK